MFNEAARAQARALLDTEIMAIRIPGVPGKYDEGILSRKTDIRSVFLQTLYTACLLEEESIRKKYGKNADAYAVLLGNVVRECLEAFSVGNDTTWEDGVKKVRRLQELIYESAEFRGMFSRIACDNLMLTALWMNMVVTARVNAPKIDGVDFANKLREANKFIKKQGRIRRTIKRLWDFACRRKPVGGEHDFTGFLDIVASEIERYERNKEGADINDEKNETEA